jgi:hypothetical protein
MLDDSKLREMEGKSGGQAVVPSQPHQLDNDNTNTNIFPVHFEKLNFHLFTLYFSNM